MKKLNQKDFQEVKINNGQLILGGGVETGPGSVGGSRYECDWLGDDGYNAMYFEDGTILEFK